MHEHEVDESGRVVRTIVTREPEWDADQRAWMLGLAMREAEECNRCGGDLTETLDYEKWNWVPQPPAVCLRCLALNKDQEKYAKHPERAGMIYHVAKVPRKQRKPRRRKG